MQTAHILSSVVSPDDAAFEGRVTLDAGGADAIAAMSLGSGGGVAIGGPGWLLDPLLWCV